MSWGKNGTVKNKGLRKATKTVFTNIGITFSHAIYRSHFIVHNRYRKLLKMDDSTTL